MDATLNVRSAMRSNVSLAQWLVQKMTISVLQVVALSANRSTSWHTGLTSSTVTTAVRSISAPAATRHSLSYGSPSSNARNAKSSSAYTAHISCQKRRSPLSIRAPINKWSTITWRWRKKLLSRKTLCRSELARSRKPGPILRKRWTRELRSSKSGRKI